MRALEVETIGNFLVVTLTALSSACGSTLLTISKEGIVIVFWFADLRFFEQKQQSRPGNRVQHVPIRDGVTDNIYEMHPPNRAVFLTVVFLYLVFGIAPKSNKKL